jgi:4'-phosphopantetheinyl transferase
MHAIDVYRADLDRLPNARCFALLDGGEQQRALRTSHHGTRLEFAKTRALLRVVLSRHTRRPPGSLTFAIDARGKPFLDGHHGLHFSVSHSAGMALIAVAPAPVGVDIERMDASLDFQNIAEGIFSRSEFEMLASRKGAQQADAFFAIWTRKEAYLKATGDGFSSDPTMISVDCPDGRVEDRGRGPSKAAAWHSFELPAPERFRAALVATRADAVVNVEDASDIQALLPEKEAFVC